MSERNQKKYSLMLVNSDKRAYNAFKNMLNTSNPENNINTAYSGFQHQQKQMRFPFGLTEERFLWQDNTSKLHVAAGMELQGKLKHRSSSVKNSLNGGFESFYDLRRGPASQDECNENRKIQCNARLHENINSVRVIQANRDLTPQDVKKGNKKLSSSGSMDFLISKTSNELHQKGKKVFNKSIDESRINIISHNGSEPVLTVKKNVDLRHINTHTGYAGLKSDTLSKRQYIGCGSVPFLKSEVQSYANKAMNDTARRGVEDKSGNHSKILKKVSTCSTELNSNKTYAKRYNGYKQTPNKQID